MSGETERMSAVDAAWLRMDRPTNLMMIVGVIVFDGRVDFRRFRRTIEQRFLKFPRFRCRAVPGRDDRQLGARSRLRPRPARPRNRAAHARRSGRTRVPGVAPRRHRPRPPPADVAIPLRREFRGGTAVDPAHPSLLCRRHGDGPRIPDADRLAGGPTASPPDRRTSTDASGAGDDETLAWLGRLNVPGAAFVQKAIAEGAQWFAKAVDLTRNPEQAAELASMRSGSRRTLAGRDAIRRSTHPFQGRARLAQDCRLD